MARDESSAANVRQRAVDLLWMIRASYRAGRIEEAREYERNLADDFERLASERRIRAAKPVCPNCHGTGVTRFGVCTYCNGTGK
jgi:hypothetical protein